MSKSGQYALEQQDKAYQRGEQEKDLNNLRPDEIAELDEWLDSVNDRIACAIHKPKQEPNHEHQ